MEPSKPFVEREAVVVALEHWSEKKYLILKWKKAAWYTLITGGVEKGQTPYEAAEAEIREETGYVDVEFVQSVGMHHSKFYHIPKQENRFGHFHSFHYKLKSDKHVEISQEEKDKHEPVWMTKEEATRVFHAESMKNILIWIDKKEPYIGQGILGNSGEFTLLASEEARVQITNAVGGKVVTKYKMRDAIFARQRYWGEPIPLRHDKEGIITPLREDELPLELPDVASCATWIPRILMSLRQKKHSTTGKMWICISAGKNMRQGTCSIRVSGTNSSMTGDSSLPRSRSRPSRTKASSSHPTDAR